MEQLAARDAPSQNPAAPKFLSSVPNAGYAVGLRRPARTIVLRERDEQRPPMGAQDQGLLQGLHQRLRCTRKHDAINPEAVGTKAAAHYPLIVAGGRSVRLQLRLRPHNGSGGLGDFDAVLDKDIAAPFRPPILPTCLVPAFAGSGRG